MVGAVKKSIIVLTLLFLYLPIIVLMIYSFNSSQYLGAWEGFSFKWYIELFNNKEITQSLYYTIGIAVLATIISTVVGVFVSVGLYYSNSKIKKAVTTANYLPIVNPDLITGISLMIFFVILRIRFGFSTMLLAHIIFDVAYVIVVVLPKLMHIDFTQIEAAMDLGAKRMTILLKIILPQIKQGILAGALLAFTMSIDDFVISFFTAGNRATNLSISIYSMARKGIKPYVNALATLMFVGIIVLILIIGKINNEREEKGRLLNYE
jgi:spermidine/putrescine transport system permease protein